MILSEKITELRKRNGLSQEEFGARIGVSRQAVSKWEMAQTTPDVAKVLAMAEVFEVPVDFLLKDEYDLSYLNAKPAAAEIKEPAPAENDRYMLSLEEAQEYFKDIRQSTKKIILAIILFFISPFAGIYLTVTGDEKLGILGVIIQIIFLIGVAICIVLAVWQLKGYKHIRSAKTELAYGVKGVAEEYKKNFEHTHLIGIIIGVILIIASVIPMMVCALFTEEDIITVSCAALMLLMLAAGISFVVYVSLINSGYARIIRKIHN